jgi:hypothetical protein
MASSVRKPGKNIQAPCVTCTRPATLGLLQPRTNNPVEHLQIHQGRDACEGLGNDSLRNLSLFFSDPAAAPGTTQSPIRSPTEFPLLFRSPAQHTIAYPAVMQSQLTITPGVTAIGSGNGIMVAVPGLPTVTISINIPLTITATSPTPTNIYVTIPTTHLPALPSLLIATGIISGTCIGGSHGAQPSLTQNSNGQWVVQFGTADIPLTVGSCVVSVNFSLTAP